MFVSSFASASDPAPDPAPASAFASASASASASAFASATVKFSGEAAASARPGEHNEALKGARSSNKPQWSIAPLTRTTDGVVDVSPQLRPAPRTSVAREMPPMSFSPSDLTAAASVELPPKKSSSRRLADTGASTPDPAQATAMSRALRRSSSAPKRPPLLSPPPPPSLQPPPPPPLSLPSPLGSDEGAASASARLPTAADARRRSGGGTVALSSLGKVHGKSEMRQGQVVNAGVSKSGESTAPSCVGIQQEL